MIAARTPAKRAAKVSPVTAVSGNSEITGSINHAAKVNLFKIETALGIHHAVAAKKTLILMTGSFSLSIILFLRFSVLVLDTIDTMDGVKRIFGRRSVFNVPAQLNANAVEIDMISYDDFDLNCLVKDNMLKKGSDISKVYGNSHYVLAAWGKDSFLEIGDKIFVADEEFEIAGLLKYDPFNSDGLTNGEITLITSGDTFIRLTGITDYSLIMVQTTSDVTDEDVTAIRDLLDGDCTLNDLRDQRTSGTYTAFVFCIYASLAIIALITVLNIVNSISMSVSSKIKSYGAMRAVGMNEHQITKMIVAEAFTYALLGGIVGSIVGLIVYRLLYTILIGTHFSYAIWSFPAIPLLIILLFVCMAAIIAAYIPAKRIHNMAITEIINEL